MASDLLRSVRELLKRYGKPEREVYLDSENSGLVLEEALEEMLQVYREAIGHPSITNRPGWEAYEALYRASERIARAIGAEVEELAYTHSGTEANNLAILGLAKACGVSRRKIVVSAIEHLSVIFPAEELAKAGYKLIKVPVDEEGFVKLDELATAVDRETLLVSIGLVNHEIGTIQDLKALVEVVKDRDEDIIFHTDAADALGKVRLDVEELNVDMATFSSHKVYGPKGAGALYVRDGVKLEPILRGQLSAQRLWPGVENVPAIAGFGKAVEVLTSRLDEYVSHMQRLRDMLIDGIMDNIRWVLLNGPHGGRRAPGNVNVSFLYCEGEALTVELSMHGVYVSSGSACTSRALEASHVLLAIGRGYEEAHGSILMKVTPMHTREDVEYVLEQLPRAVERIRSLVPIRGG
ncbi:MAG: cysteine desulfurase [Thermoprotei archaeon]|nr:MAG: cysteine desulfurase [Thermoprotei archaeon]